MSANLVALVAGTVLAVGALAYVLYPLFFEVRDAEPAAAPRQGAADDSAIVALREIEFDRATGKLSDSDYQELRNTYAPRALRELRGADAAAEAPDDIEARILAFRATHRECTTCGLRPEADAVYCSTCGSYLPGACPHCAAPIGEAGATFCSSCGHTLSPAAAAMA